MEFRLGEFQIRIDHGKSGVLTDLIHKARHKIAEHINTWRLQDKLNRKPTALFADTLRFYNHNAHIRVIRTHALNSAGNFTLRAPFTFVLVERYSNHRTSIATNACLNFFIFRRIHHRRDAIHKTFCEHLVSCHPHTFRHTRVHHDRATIFLWRHFTRHLCKAIKSDAHQSENQYKYNTAHFHKLVESTGIKRIEFLKEGLCNHKQSALLLLAQKFGTEHGRKR